MQTADDDNLSLVVVVLYYDVTNGQKCDDDGDRSVGRSARQPARLSNHHHPEATRARGKMKVGEIKIKASSSATQHNQQVATSLVALRLTSLLLLPAELISGL